jgi:hypothetical protein
MENLGVSLEAFLSCLKSNFGLKFQSPTSNLVISGIRTQLTGLECGLGSS